MSEVKTINSLIKAMISHGDTYEAGLVKALQSENAELKKEVQQLRWDIAELWEVKADNLQAENTRLKEALKTISAYGNLSESSFERIMSIKILAESALNPDKK